jgi:serine/threonine protein kinase
MWSPTGAQQRDYDPAVFPSCSEQPARCLLVIDAALAGARNYLGIANEPEAGDVEAELQLPPEAMRMELDPAHAEVNMDVEMLGSGAFADARRGTYRFRGGHDTAVAFKIFRGLAGGLGAADMTQLRREIAAGGQLRHDNLVRMYGFVRLPGQGPALVLELAAGPVPGGLRGVLSDRASCPALPWARRVRWLAEIAAGMAELHGLLPKPIIHRDLKAANVLLSCAYLSAAVAKVADFGIARTMDTMRCTLPAGGGVAGTLAWNAPETFRGSYGPASDVFSFGVLAFEVASRETPWAGVSQPEVIGKTSAMFDPTAKAVQRLIARGISVEEQRDEWIEDNPLADRRPDLTAAEAGCPPELLALLRCCWADDPAPGVRPSFAQVRKAPSWPRRWANSRLSQLCFHRNARASSHLLGQPNTVPRCQCLEELGRIRPLRETLADSNFKAHYANNFEPITLASEVF